MFSRHATHPSNPGVACVVCRTHCRPFDVPWSQHAIGCAVRDAAVRHEHEHRPVTSRVAGLATL